MKKSELIQRKFIQSYNIQDYEILTDTGWQDILSIHKTVQYDVWTIQTQTGKKLSGADNHIVFRQDLSQIFLCQLKIGDKIITQDGYQKIINVIDQKRKQNMYDITVNSENHRFFSNGILSHNSTSYSLYVLWYVLINHDKNVLICANRLKTAMQILGRIKMAYQELPIWLKPGIVKWNSTTIQLSNGCKVSAEATSQSSGRGSSINLLLLDEFAFIAPNMQQAFMQSVFPVISSSKTSQVIIVSTPNGTNNEYYRIWSKATNNDPNDLKAWHQSRIDWWDVPGRDEQWKKQQLATFNNDMARFNQEFGNCVCQNTIVQIYDQKTSNVLNISIKKLKQLLEFQNDN